MNIYLIVIFIIILLSCFLFIKFFNNKKEKYTGTWQEEFQTFQTLSNVLGELCDEYPNICKELNIKNPLSRTIKQDYNYLKRMNEILNEDIQKVVNRQKYGKRTVDLDPEFIKMYQKFSDFSRYINILCNKYKNLCLMLNIKNPISLPNTQSKDKLKYYFQKLINNYQKLINMIEIFEKGKSSDPDILYDWDDEKQKRVNFLPPIIEEDEKV